MTGAVRAAAVRAATEGLVRAGAGPGRRVAIQVEPSPAGLAVILGAARTGATLSLLHPRWSPVEVERVIQTFEPTLVVGDGAPSGVGGAEPSRTPVTHFPEPSRRHVNDVVPTAAVSGDSGDDLRSLLPLDADPRPTWILWTSGTSTGTPRGVVLSHDAFLASARGTARRLDLRPSDRWLCTLSPAHVGGLALVLRAAFVGSTLLGAGRPDTARVAQDLEALGVTHASLVPTQLRRLLDHRGDRPAPSTLRALLLGGAATPSGLLDRALELGYPVALTWGMTEAASQVATAEPDRVRRKPGTVGPPLPGVEVQVAEVDTESAADEATAAEPATAADAPGSRAGELRVRGPTLATGYFDGPHGPPRPITDAEGWYRTGDLGAFDPEGDLRIRGRLADRIISGGVNVSPGEVEAAILTHPDVSEVAVAGVPHPEWGEEVTAWVVLREGASGLPLEDLRDFLRPRLSAPKRPRALHRVETLPRNANGKVDRARLVEEIRRSS